jgi:hypothetical protein
MPAHRAKTAFTESARNHAGAVASFASALRRFLELNEIARFSAQAASEIANVLAFVQLMNLACA